MKINRTSLPADYRLVETLDAENDKKHAFAVNTLSFILTAAVFVIAWFWKGFSLGELAFLSQWLVALCVTIVGYIAYVFLHELVHFLTAFAFTGKEPKYVYRFPFYVVVDTRAFLTRWEYVAVMLMPSLVFGVIFLIMGIFLDGPWFWCVCFLQAGNIGGSAGDFCYAFKTACGHHMLRVYDSGKERSFYLPQRVRTSVRRK